MRDDQSLVEPGRPFCRLSSTAGNSHKRRTDPAVLDLWEEGFASWIGRTRHDFLRELSIVERNGRHSLTEMSPGLAVCIKPHLARCQNRQSLSTRHLSVVRQSRHPTVRPCDGRQVHLYCRPLSTMVIWQPRRRDWAALLFVTYTAVIHSAGMAFSIGCRR